MVTDLSEYIVLLIGHRINIRFPLSETVKLGSLSYCIMLVPEIKDKHACS